MFESGSIDWDENSMGIVISDEENADFSQAEAPPRQLEVPADSSSFLQGLGLMKIKTKETPAVRVLLSKSRGTDTDKNIGGSLTSASKKLKSKSAGSTEKKTKHVSKPKKKVKKRSHATSFDDEPPSMPVVNVKKIRKPAAPGTDKSTTKKQPQGKKEHQHTESPPATKDSSSERESTIEAAADFSELSSAGDDVWSHISESDFMSTDFCAILKNNEFTDEQTEAIQKSFQYLSRNFCSKPTSFDRFLKTYQCIDCDFFISHECMSMNSNQYWCFQAVIPCIESITPESTIMCLCNFAFFHSHKPQPQRRPKSKLPIPSPQPIMFNWVPDKPSVNFNCSDCCMKISMSNRACSDMMEFSSVDGPIRRRFAKFVFDNWDAPRGRTLPNFNSCSSDCCFVFHCCDKNVRARRFMPIQNHRPLVCCED